MAAFQKLFYVIDKENTGVITIADLRDYMHRMKYTEGFVTSWTNLFDPDHTGLITYEKYCKVLGLIPAAPKTHDSSAESTSEASEPPVSSATVEEAPTPNPPEVVEEVIQSKVEAKEVAEEPNSALLTRRRRNTNSVGQETDDSGQNRRGQGAKQTRRKNTKSFDGKESPKLSGGPSRKRKYTESPPKGSLIEPQPATTVGKVERPPSADAADGTKEDLADLPPATSPEPKESGQDAEVDGESVSPSHTQSPTLETSSRASVEAAQVDNKPAERTEAVAAIADDEPVGAGEAAEDSATDVFDWLITANSQPMESEDEQDKTATVLHRHEGISGASVDSIIIPQTESLTLADEPPRELESMEWNTEAVDDQKASGLPEPELAASAQAQSMGSVGDEGVLQAAAACTDSLSLSPPEPADSGPREEVKESKPPTSAAAGSGKAQEPESPTPASSPLEQAERKEAKVRAKKPADAKKRTKKTSENSLGEADVTPSRDRAAEAKTAKGRSEESKKGKKREKRASESAKVEKKLSSAARQSSLPEDFVEHRPLSGLEGGVAGDAETRKSFEADAEASSGSGSTRPAKKAALKKRTKGEKKTERKVQPVMAAELQQPRFLEEDIMPQVADVMRSAPLPEEPPGATSPPDGRTEAAESSAMNAAAAAESPSDVGRAEEASPEAVEARLPSAASEDVEMSPRAESATSVSWEVAKKHPMAVVKRHPMSVAKKHPMHIVLSPSPDGKGAEAEQSKASVEGGEGEGREEEEEEEEGETVGMDVEAEAPLEAVPDAAMETSPEDVEDAAEKLLESPAPGQDEAEEVDVEVEEKVKVTEGGATAEEAPAEPRRKSSGASEKAEDEAEEKTPSTTCSRSPTAVAEEAPASPERTAAAAKNKRGRKSAESSPPAGKDEPPPRVEEEILPSASSLAEAVGKPVEGPQPSKTTKKSSESRKKTPKQKKSTSPPLRDDAARPPPAPDAAREPPRVAEAREEQPSDEGLERAAPTVEDSASPSPAGGSEKPSRSRKKSSGSRKASEEELAGTAPPKAEAASAVDAEPAPAVAEASAEPGEGDGKPEEVAAGEGDAAEGAVDVPASLSASAKSSRKPAETKKKRDKMAAESAEASGQASSAADVHADVAGEQSAAPSAAHQVGNAAPPKASRRKKPSEPREDRVSREEESEASKLPKSGGGKASEAPSKGEAGRGAEKAPKPSKRKATGCGDERGTVKEVGKKHSEAETPAPSEGDAAATSARPAEGGDEEASETRASAAKKRAAKSDKQPQAAPRRQKREGKKPLSAADAQPHDSKAPPVEAAAVVDADADADAVKSEAPPPPPRSRAAGKKKRKAADASDDSPKKRSKEEKKKSDRGRKRRQKEPKEPKAEEEGEEKLKAKKSKRPRVGNLECGRFPRAFATQVGHRVRQHRRDGARVPTHGLGKAPKGTTTKKSIERRRRDKPSKNVGRWRLRKSLRKVGTIVILVAGRHRGKRAVVVGRHRFSGLLLITGPFKCNGIPVRRIHPDYVIATKTRIRMSRVPLPKRMQTREYFARQKPQTRGKNAADNLFVNPEANRRTYKLTEERREDQKVVDRHVIRAIKHSKDAKMLFAYLQSQFSLSRSDKPHKMIF